MLPALTVQAAFLALSRWSRCIKQPWKRRCDKLHETDNPQPIGEELLQRRRTHEAEIQGWQKSMLSSPASLQVAARQLFDQAWKVTKRTCRSRLVSSVFSQLQYSSRNVWYFIANEVWYAHAIVSLKEVWWGKGFAKMKLAFRLYHICYEH